MEMTEYILAILRTQLMVVYSWGTHSLMSIENGLSFKVQGYKHTGRVEVLYDEGADLFTVRIINRDGTLKDQQDGIYVDGLVETIDNLVEKTDDYRERVRRDYSIVG